MIHKTPAVLLEQTYAALQRHDDERAVATCARLVKEHPESIEGHVLFSQIMQERGRFALCLDSARKAVALDKTRVQPMLQLSRAYQHAGFLQQAIQAAERTEQLLGESGDEVSSLGTQYFHLGQFEAAVRMHRRALEQDRGDPVYWYNLGISLQAAGDLDGAEEAFDEVLRIDPKEVRALMNLSRLKKQTAASNHIPQLQALLTEFHDDPEKAKTLSYALSKEYEDVGDHARSFTYLKSGSDLQRAAMDYDVADELRMIDVLIEAMPAGIFQRCAPGHASEEPIFIVGMPRSGTTLTEQIIAAHDDVFAAGELRDFPLNLALQAGMRGASDQLDGIAIQRLLGTSPEQLGKRYIDKTRPRTGQTARFIDKLPRNSQLAGLIHWALPRAKIILLDRHPVDVCFSNYKMLFRAGYDYSYTLEELADYYLAWRRLMDHWQAIIPAENFYRLSYEDLVAEQESESRKLIAFCGLDWQNACLEFYRNSESVNTASLAQVRQPIYRTAVARWRHYAPWLRPLIDRLEAGGIDCG